MHVLSAELYLSVCRKVDYSESIDFLNDAAGYGQVYRDALYDTWHVRVLLDISDLTLVEILSNSTSLAGKSPDKESLSASLHCFAQDESGGERVIEFQVNPEQTPQDIDDQIGQANGGELYVCAFPGRHMTLVTSE